MGIRVKTTIDIADGLLSEAKDRARLQDTTLRALVEEGLRMVLGSPLPRAQFKPVTGELEPLPGVDAYDWNAIRDEIYRP